MALSEQEVLTRLFELENDEEADRRARLTGDRYLSLFLGKVDGKSYVFLHGPAADGGFSTDNSEFYVYETSGEAEGTYDQMLGEFRESGNLVEEDSLEDLGDFVSSGPDPDDMAELRNSTDDPLEVPEPTDEHLERPPVVPEE